jgi:predicted ester cyclase
VPGTDSHVSGKCPFIPVRGGCGPWHRPGRAGLADVLTGMFTAFPDLRWTLRDTIAEDDRIMTLSTWTGTHRGPFMGIPATGRAVSVES